MKLEVLPGRTKLSTSECFPAPWLFGPLHRDSVLVLKPELVALQLSHTVLTVFVSGSWQVNGAPSLSPRPKEIEKKSWSWCWTGLLKDSCLQDRKDSCLQVINDYRNTVRTCVCLVPSATSDFCVSNSSRRRCCCTSQFFWLCPVGLPASCQKEICFKK